jgi:hypothetical protein
LFIFINIVGAIDPSQNLAFVFIYIVGAIRKILFSGSALVPGASDCTVAAICAGWNFPFFA